MFAVRENRKLLVSHPLRPPAGTSSSTTLPYSYTPLDGRTCHIRLLDLLPGHWNDPLAGIIRVVSLDVKPLYEAVSYTWGDSTEKHEIKIDKLYKLKTTDNLYRALRRFRRQFTKRTLWVDAICIDQSNSHEKGHQVAMMGRVYRLAANVLVWLGEYPKATRRDSVKMRQPHWERKGTSTQLNAQGRRFAKALDMTIRTAEPKWQERAWVLQEFILSRKACICFGPICMAYSPVYFIDLLMSLTVPHPGLRAFHERVSDMWSLKTGITERPHSISEVALRTSTAASSKPQDKVYSLLSIIDKREASNIGVDYEECCEKTYARATFASILCQKNFAILELVGFTGAAPSRLPSWVVDFTNEQIPTDGQINLRLPPQVLSPRDMMNCANFVALSSDATLLTAPGTQFDRIVATLKLPTAIYSSKLEGDIATKVAEDVSVFLEGVFRSRDLRPRQARGDLSLIAPSLFLAKDCSTRVRSMIIASFAIWEEVASETAECRSDTCRTFWECDENDPQKSFRLPEWADIRYFMEYAGFVSNGLSMFATASGYIGMAPATLLENDILALLVNCNFPVVIRKYGETHNFRGFAYVYDIRESKLSVGWERGDISGHQFVFS